MSCSLCFLLHSMADQFVLSELDADGVIMAGPVDMIKSVRTFRYFYNHTQVKYEAMKYLKDQTKYTHIKFGQVAGLDMYTVSPQTFPFQLCTK